MDPNIPVQTQQPVAQQSQAPAPPINQAPVISHKLRRMLLIILGILEIPFPYLGAYLTFPLLDLQKNLGVSSMVQVLGLIFFCTVIIISFLQILTGILNWELRIGSKKTKLLLGIGLLLAILMIPAIILFVVNPIYGNITSVQ